jgi:hypothetical protein
MKDAGFDHQIAVDWGVILARPASWRDVVLAELSRAPRSCRQRSAREVVRTAGFARFRARLEPLNRP